MEIWRDIPSYKDLYQISNYGSIKNKKRNKLLKPGRDTNGYLQVMLSKQGLPRCFKIHQLVAITFLNHKPNNRKFNIDHINENIYDNYVGNLQILTLREHRNKTLNKEFIGAQFDKRRGTWYSQIRTSEGKKYLGTFNTALEASNAYKQKLIQL